MQCRLRSYQITVLELPSQSSSEGQTNNCCPLGIEGLPDLGEIYPLGGSADRFGLVDPETGECLLAVMLPYCRRTLMEGLIRDLQFVIILSMVNPLFQLHFKWFHDHGRNCATVQQKKLALPS
ncbi:unnamed protein product [Fraxinus pennsylvanica]|uniref:Uncharacterized protein n=1 Tax=Fraxinus pennsylvanica TaxID=56036 RepID=A0AAD1YTS8_9LAMI|nr:unnamed protein product [Fraxinus pennsylvanica]